MQTPRWPNKCRSSQRSEGGSKLLLFETYKWGYKSSPPREWGEQYIYIYIFYVHIICTYTWRTLYFSISFWNFSLRSAVHPSISLGRGLPSGLFAPFRTRRFAHCILSREDCSIFVIRRLASNCAIGPICYDNPPYILKRWTPTRYIYVTAAWSQVQQSVLKVFSYQWQNINHSYVVPGIYE